MVCAIAALRWTVELVVGDPRHVDREIDAIEQRARDTPPVAAQLAGIAHARTVWISVVATRASPRCLFASGGSGQRNPAQVPTPPRFPRSGTTSERRGSTSAFGSET